MAIDVNRSINKTDLEKHYRVSRPTLLKMLKQVPDLKITTSWTFTPLDLQKIINHYG